MMMKKDAIVIQQVGICRVPKLSLGLGRSPLCFSSNIIYDLLFVGIVKLDRAELLLCLLFGGLVVFLTHLCTVGLILLDAEFVV
jgi:hypothetical protein